MCVRVPHLGGALISLTVLPPKALTVSPEISEWNIVSSCGPSSCSNPSWVSPPCAVPSDLAAACAASSVSGSPSHPASWQLGSIGVNSPLRSGPHMAPTGMSGLHRPYAITAKTHLTISKNAPNPIHVILPGCFLLAGGPVVDKYACVLHCQFATAIKPDVPCLVGTVFCNPGNTLWVHACLSQCFSRSGSNLVKTGWALPRSSCRGRAGGRHLATLAGPHLESRCVVLGAAVPTCGLCWRSSCEQGPTQYLRQCACLFVLYVWCCLRVPAKTPLPIFQSHGTFASQPGKQLD